MTDHDERDTASEQARSQRRQPADEEAQQREHVGATGEPERDALGNEDGAS